MPIKSLEEILNKALSRQGGKKVAIAAAEGEYVIKAALKAREMGLVTPIFVGDNVQIKKLSQEIDGNIKDEDIRHAPDSESSAKLAVSLVRNGEAQMLMKGLIPTNVFLRQVLNKETGISEKNILSHLAIFEASSYHKIFGITDAALNIAPSLNEKLSIIENSVEAMRKLGIEIPKVALLSAIEKVNPKIPSSAEAEMLTRFNKEGQIKNCMIDGPLALDAAISSESARHKGINSAVAGDADLLVVPEINSGNILYKSLTYLAKAKTAAVILGAKAPVILTSRSDREENKLYSIALAICLE